MTFRETISKEEVNALTTLASFPGQIHVIDTLEEVDAAFEYLNKQTVVGFDTENKPVFFSRVEPPEVSLVQISTTTDAYLFRTNLIDFPEPLCQFIANPNIFKIGLSLKDDYKLMRRRTAIEPKGFVELQKLCPGYGIKDAGLQRIYAILFNERISKSQRLTNWEADKLSPKQQGYAALDAYACLRIYNYLMEFPAPPPFAFAMM